MQNSLESDFKNVVYQNFLKYFPQHIGTKSPNDGYLASSNINALASIIWNNPRPNLVKTLWPVAIMIGMFEILIGVAILMYVGYFTQDYDTLYNTEDSKLISNLSFAGSADLIITGFVLMLGLMMERERMIRLHMFMSIFLCVYIFVLACIKIYLSLLVIEKTEISQVFIGSRDEKVIKEAIRHKICLSTSCIIGIATLMGSVIHGIATMTVFTYYNLKYIQSTL